MENATLLWRWNIVLKDGARNMEMKMLAMQDQYYTRLLEERFDNTKTHHLTMGDNEKVERLYFECDSTHSTNRKHEWFESERHVLALAKDEMGAVNSSRAQQVDYKIRWK